MTPLRKALQNQLAQLISLKNDATRLKLAIIEANMSTKLPNGLTLYEGIIELANTGSAIYQLQDLIQIGRKDSS